MTALAFIRNLACNGGMIGAIVAWSRILTLCAVSLLLQGTDWAQETLRSLVAQDRSLMDIWRCSMCTDSVCAASATDLFDALVIGFPFCSHSPLKSTFWSCSGLMFDPSATISWRYRFTETWTVMKRMSFQARRANPSILGHIKLRRRCGRCGMCHWPRPPDAVIEAVSEVRASGPLPQEHTSKD